MKRFLMVILTMGLILMVASGVLATQQGTRANAIIDPLFFSPENSFLLDVSKMDSWYSVRPETSNLKAFYFNTTQLSDYALQFFQNDQTRASYETMTIGTNSLSVISASYLFNFGLFVGANQITMTGSSATTLVAPGYRFNIGDNGYVALKYVDNTTDTSTNSNSYYADGKYHDDQMYLRAAVSYPTQTSTTMSYNFGLNYQVADEAVVGLQYASHAGDTAYELGLTWGGISQMVIDGKYGQDDAASTYYSASGMYKVTDNLSVGAEYDNQNGNQAGLISVKAKYIADNSQFALKYTLADTTDNIDAQYIVVYQMNL